MNKIANMAYQAPIAKEFVPSRHSWGSTYVNSKLSPLVDPMSTTEAKLGLLTSKQSLLNTGFNAMPVDPIKFRSSTGDLIDAVKFSTPESSTRSINDRVAILFCIGRGGSLVAIAKAGYADITMVQFMQRQIPEGDIFIINPAGVGESEGTVSYDSSVLSHYGSMKLVETLGYKAIYVHGHSLGAWRSLEASSLFSRENPDFPLCVVADRSFRNFADLAVSSTVGDGYLGDFLKSCFRWGKLSKDVTPFLCSLGDKAITVFGDGDTTVPVEKRLPAIATSFNLRNTGADSEHTRAYTSEEEQVIGEAIRTRLNLPIRA